MLTKKHSIEGKRPFTDPAGIFGAIDADAAKTLAMVAGDVVLVLDPSGTILDASFEQDAFPKFGNLVGENWIDTVTVESRPKIMEMLAGARKGETQHWRQVNHPTSGSDIPVKYVVVSIDGGSRAIAFGRDLREFGKVQQRLLQVQQSLERDYLRMRHVEARYRLLFEASSEPVIIVDAGDYRIREANPAAHALVGARAGSLIDKKLLGLFARQSAPVVTAHLGSALASNSVSPVPAMLDKGSTEVEIQASGFSQDRRQYLLVRLASGEREVSTDDSATLDVIEKMPDAFVLTDARMQIVTANTAFVELVGAAGQDQLRGANLSGFVGRPGIDLELIANQIEKEGDARNVTTVLRAMNGSEDEPIEISAVSTQGDDPQYGLVIRPIARRMRDLPPSSEDLPRSVEQLTDLVGRMPLKDIVRESTDLIERLCIEAALLYTSDNRASAAEILGLSRQSLYSKLHRYGLGNLAAESE
ncbi:transcriptional regulator PpsR [Qipengyuania sp. G39]|uniref:Transcriptional regulator PpsR n=1 Tax=Qipengyuania profundimaris TaxID=3067652 RepID=A0ABT9HP87_9SPHN|nr:transcriptional regulator PpsR [Qipengyuania sp. G39]MDP4574964.1 transcriptional regulator PpsR [Qipengyuania sp. G39]